MQWMLYFSRADYVEYSREIICNFYLLLALFQLWGTKLGRCTIFFQSKAKFLFCFFYTYYRIFIAKIQTSKKDGDWDHVCVFCVWFSWPWGWLRVWPGRVMWFLVWGSELVWPLILNLLLLAFPTQFYLPFSESICFFFFINSVT